MSAGAQAPGAQAVRRALATARVNSAQIRGIVAHFADGQEALSPFLRDDAFEQIVPQTESDHETLSCFTIGSAGVGLAAFTYLAHGGTTPVPSVTLREPAAGYGDRLRDQWRALRPGREPDVDPETTRLEASRPSRVSLTDTVSTEFLVEVAPDARPPRSLRAVAEIVTEVVARASYALAFVHAPASPPAKQGHWRHDCGPCIRFGVATPRRRVADRLAFVSALIDVCVDHDLDLWTRGTAGPAAPHDYWQRLVPVTRPDDQVPELIDPPRPVAGGGLGARAAITCVGPARHGTVAAVMRLLDQSPASLLALSENRLDDLSVVHLVLGTAVSGRAAADLGLPAAAALRRALGLGPGDDPADHALDDFRVMITPFAPRSPVWAAPRRQALWLSWSTPTGHDILAETVRFARLALEEALARRQLAHRRAEPSIEYLVSRVVPVDRLRGRAKVTLDLDALAGVDAVGPGDTDWLGRFCSDIETHWRSGLTFALGTPRVDLEVVWRESWLGRPPVL